jgi:hypothetical protein
VLFEGLLGSAWQAGEGVVVRGVAAEVHRELATYYNPSCSL